MTEEVQLRINDNKGAFYIEIEGKQEAMMTFVFAGEDKIIIDHTEVNPISKEDFYKFIKKWEVRE